MVVDVPYVVASGGYEEEFTNSDDLFCCVIGSLSVVPDELLPVSIQIINIDEFAIEQIDRDIHGFYFQTENHRSKLARKFKKFMKGWVDE